VPTVRKTSVLSRNQLFIMEEGLVVVLGKGDRFVAFKHMDHIPDAMKPTQIAGDPFPQCDLY
jgi:hypothetical protein